MTIKRGAGLLPFARHEGFIYLFLGRENMEGGHSASGKWSDFGGSKSLRPNVFTNNMYILKNNAIIKSD